MQPMTDEQQQHVIALLERIAHHDVTPARRRDAEVALRELYDQVGGRLYAVAMRVLNNAGWAEDVLQDAFMQIWRNAQDYKSTLSPPMAWLGLIARSRALDFLRRRASERLDKSVELDDELGETLEGQSPDPLDAHDASEHATALHECLRKLEPKHREVVSLAYYRDLSHSELAEQLKLPLGTVKTWVRRALEQLRTCMGRFA
jgi:RNA polymerase sigma factor (sigma-70 family)